MTTLRPVRRYRTLRVCVADTSRYNALQQVTRILETARIGFVEDARIEGDVPLRGYVFDVTISDLSERE